MKNIETLASFSLLLETLEKLSKRHGVATWGSLVLFILTTYAFTAIRWCCGDYIGITITAMTADIAIAIITLIKLKRIIGVEITGELAEKIKIFSAEKGLSNVLIRIYFVLMLNLIGFKFFYDFWTLILPIDNAPSWIILLYPTVCLGFLSGYLVAAIKKI